MNALPAPLPRWRLALLRIGYGVIAVGLAVNILPRLIWLPAGWTSSAAVVTCFLAAMMTLCAIGVFRPIEMLPVMLFELVWKFVFMLRIALPAMVDGSIRPDIQSVFYECVPIVPFVLLVPWVYVWRRLIRSESAVPSRAV